MKKKNILRNLKKLAEKISEKNIQTEDGMAYMEEDVDDGRGRAKKAKAARRKENGG